MNLKLEELTQDIVVVSSTAEEWATVNNILLIGGKTPFAKNGDSFETFPLTSIDKLGNEYVNTNHAFVEHAEAITGSKSILIPASDFIAANTLANITTNLNTPTQESMNA